MGLKGAHGKPLARIFREHPHSFGVTVEPHRLAGPNAEIVSAAGKLLAEFICFENCSLSASSLLYVLLFETATILREATNVLHKDGKLWWNSAV
jgi:hypothetical protein